MEGTMFWREKYGAKYVLEGINTQMVMWEFLEILIRKEN